MSAICDVSDDVKKFVGVPRKKKKKKKKKNMQVVWHKFNAVR